MDEYVVELDRHLVVCATPGCGHVESFHNTGKDGTWCLALNCACTEWKAKEIGHELPRP